MIEACFRHVTVKIIHNNNEAIMNKKLFKTITKKIIIVLLCFSAVITASVTLFLLFWQQMPKEISYKEANFSHTVGAVAISDMTDGKKTKKRDGFIVLLNNDGTSQTIATSAIDSPAILWNTDGLYFVDAKFDYFLAQKSNARIAIKHRKKTPAQAGIFENNQHEVISVLDRGFTRSRKNKLEFNSITLGKPQNTDIMQSRIYDVSSACESGTYTISPSDNGTNSFNGTNGFVIKKLQDSMPVKHILKNSKTKVHNFSTIRNDTSPCISNTIISLGDTTKYKKDDPDFAFITYGINQWNTQSGKFDFIPLTLQNKRIAYNYGEKHDFENISYGNRTMLNDHELLALDQGTGVLYKINIMTGETQIIFTTPVSTSNNFNPQRYWMQATKDTIAILDNANSEKTPRATLYFLNKKNFKLQQTVHFDNTTSNLLAGKVSGCNFGDFAINPQM